MNGFFEFLAVVVALFCLPCGYFCACRCTKNVGGRVVLTIVFGFLILVAGWFAVISGCTALQGGFGR